MRFCTLHWVTKILIRAISNVHAGCRLPTPGLHELDGQTQVVSGNTVQQVAKFNYLGMVFTSDGRLSEEIDTRIGKANAALRELYRSVVTKRELSNTEKLSVFKLVFVPILIYGHDSWVMSERILIQVQAPEMGFLRRVHDMTCRG